jgi:hypothetical protein
MRRLTDEMEAAPNRDVLDRTLSDVSRSRPIAASTGMVSPTRTASPTKTQNAALTGLGWDIRRCAGELADCRVGGHCERSAHQERRALLQLSCRA